jgi:hypothetical protein
VPVTYNGLLPAGGHYYRLYTQQFKFQRELEYSAVALVPVIK